MCGWKRKPFGIYINNHRSLYLRPHRIVCVQCMYYCCIDLTPLPHSSFSPPAPGLCFVFFFSSQNSVFPSLAGYATYGDILDKLMHFLSQLSDFVPLSKTGFIVSAHRLINITLLTLVQATVFFFLVFFAHIYFPASGQAVVTGVVPSSPLFYSLHFLSRIGFSYPTARRFFIECLLTHALAFSASQFVRIKKPPRFFTSMHSGGFELTKLTYTRLEDKPIRHRGDRQNCM